MSMSKWLRNFARLRNVEMAAKWCESANQIMAAKY